MKRSTPRAGYWFREQDEPFAAKQNDWALYELRESPLVSSEGVAVPPALCARTIQVGLEPTWLIVVGVGQPADLGAGMSLDSGLAPETSTRYLSDLDWALVPVSAGQKQEFEGSEVVP